MSDRADPTRDYFRRLRRALAGLPRPDVDDLCDELGSHVAQCVDEGASLEEAHASLGSPEEVASEFVARRLRPEGRPPLAEASRGRRITAAIADLIIGWGPLVIVPIWMALIALVVDRYFMSPALIRSLSAQYGYERATLPLPLLLATGVIVGWGVFYWSWLRARSLSVGMRMAGISRVNDGDGTVVVRAADLADSEPASIVSRPKWFLAAPVALFGLVVAFAGLYYVTMAVGSFLQPWDSMAQAVYGREDLERSDDVYLAFFDAVIAGDTEAAQALAEPALANEVEMLVRQAQSEGIERVELGMDYDGARQIHEYPSDGGAPETVLVSVRRHEEQRVDSGEFVTIYRISSIEPSVVP